MSFVVGCGREESKTLPPPSAPAAAVDDYMKDPAFRRLLADGRAARNELAGTLERLRGEMAAKVDAMRASMPGADDAAVKAVLEKDAAWNELRKKTEDVVKAIDYERRKLTAKVGERIAPKRAAAAASAEAVGKQVGDAAKTAEAVRRSKAAEALRAASRSVTERDGTAKEEISK